ncbi:MAG: type II toxin-antitoxin system Phd/YefM family antitoxin [Egibacteraceae bacterium]
MKTLPLAEAKNRLSAVVSEITATHESVTVTVNGWPAVVMLAVEDFESIMETLALIENDTDRQRLAEAEESVAAGDVSTGEEMAELMRARAEREARTA